MNWEDAPHLQPEESANMIPLDCASPGLGTIRVGDTITIAGVYRLAWWKRALIRLGLMKRPDPPPPLTPFTVTWITGR